MTTHRETKRFAPYIEDQHRIFLDNVNSEVSLAYHNSTFVQFTNIDVDTGFFGLGYYLSNFPSLLDMFGKFQAGLDISSLFDQIFNDSNRTVDRVVQNESRLLYSLIDIKILPKFKQGILDINAELKSAYIRGEELIQEAAKKAIEKFKTELRFRMLIVITEKWKAHLTWSKDTVSIYLEFLQLYTKSKIDIEEKNQETRKKDDLWPFTVLEHQRAALSVLQDATASSRVASIGGKKQSQWAKSLSGMVSWAIVGAQYGGWIGAIIGAVIGLGLSFL